MTILLQRISEGEDLETSDGFGAVQSEFGNLPLRQLSYHAQMKSMSVQTTVLQTFYNPFDEPIEATYVFPLAYGQSVIACEMRVAERVIHATLKERGEARREYAQAIRNGHRAALLEENRPETFSMKVGNIPAGEAIQICIRTVSQLAVVRGEWTLRLPLVVAPRYTSGLPLPRTNCGDGTADDTNQVPDASCVTPPTWLPGFASPVDLRLVVDMEMGKLNCDSDWATQLKSSLHTALIQKDNCYTGRCRVELLPGERVNRDFILRGRLRDEQTSSSVVCETDPAANTVANTVGDQAGGLRQSTFAVTIVPPSRVSAMPREVVFLLDRSGSMKGWKIDAARRGLCRLIDRLGPQDRFQVAAFDERVELLITKQPSQDGWIQATDAHRFGAVRWLSQVNAEGGTELGAAIELALRRCRSQVPGDSATNRAIVLVTDGQITGEDALLRLIEASPKNEVPRLFCLGIDRAVNGSVLERLARRTGGTYELVESQERLDEVLGSFADEIASPSLTDLSISDDKYNELNVAPANVSTLYAGRSQTIYGRTDQPSLLLFIRGRLSDGKWYEETLNMSADLKTSGQTLRALWGKERVRQLEDDLFAAGQNDDKLKQQIIDCSLQCQVLSRLTAFVAVDEAEKINHLTLPHAMQVPSSLPEGWSAHWLPLDPASRLRLPRTLSKAERTAEAAPSLDAIAEPVVHKLLQMQCIDTVQLSHARAFADQRGIDVVRALVTLQYTTNTDVAQAVASATKTIYLPVGKVTVDPRVIAMIPESVARENHVLAIAESNNALSVLMSNPHDFDTIEKLRFILNRNINALCGASDEIGQAINQYYGQVEGESAASSMQEFTDVQINHMETLADELNSSGFEPSPTRPEFRLSPQFLAQARADRKAIMPAAAGGKPTDRELNRRSSFGPVRGGGARPGIKRSMFTFGDSPIEDDDDTPIEQMLTSILQAAAREQASHVLFNLERADVIVTFIVAGLMRDQDKLHRRLWFEILSHFKSLAQLNEADSAQIQSGTFKLMVDQTEVELTLHITRESIMIEMPEAKQLASVPPEIKHWYADH